MNHLHATTLASYRYVGQLYGSGSFHKVPLSALSLFVCFIDILFQINDTTFQLVLLMGVVTNECEYDSGNWMID